MDRLKPIKVGQLSPQEIAEIEAEVSHYEHKQAASIEALKIVQKHRGWVSDDSLKAVAQLLEISAAELEGIATFYNLIFRSPVGRNVIMVCDSVSCWIKGCEQVRRKLKKKLNIDYGQTTADGEYTLLPVVCQGACDRAPVMLVDGELKTDLNDSKIDQIITKHSEG